MYICVSYIQRFCLTILQHLLHKILICYFFVVSEKAIITPVCSYKYFILILEMGLLQTANVKIYIL